MADLSDPQKFQLSDVVTKNSKSKCLFIKAGITSNKRLLVIKKGHLYYYSNVPSTYKGNIKSLENYHELPKCSIQILNIKKINGFEGNSNYFSIEFEARHMMERQDIRKTMTLQEFNFAPKNTKQMITWQFTCDNQFIKKKWVNALETLHNFYGKEKINIQKFFQNINKKEDEKVAANAMRSSLMVPWRDDQMHKSNSNESLRRSNMGNLTPRVSTSNQSPSNTKKSMSSQQKNQSPESKFNPGSSTQDIVDTFMKLEKTKSAHEPQHPVLEQSMEQSITTPRKLTLQSPKKDLLSSKSKNEQLSENILSNAGPIGQKLFPQKQQNFVQQKKEQNEQQFSEQCKKDEEQIETEQQIIKQQEQVGNKQLKKTESNLIVQKSESQAHIVNEQKTPPILSSTGESKILSNRNQEQIINPTSDPLINHKTSPTSNIVSNITSEPTITLKSNPIISSIQTSINESKSKQRFPQPQLQIKKVQESKQQAPKIKNKISIEQQFCSSFENKISITKPPSFSEVSMPESTFLSQSKNESRNSIPSSSRIEYEVDVSTKFYQLLYFSCNKQYSFEKRIEAQQKLNQMIGNFTNNSVLKFAQFVQSKSNNHQNSVRYSELKIDEGMSKLDVGNYSYKIGYVSTQSITVNQKQKVYYNEASVKNIKREMKVYDTLNSLITYHIKNMGNQVQSHVQPLSASVALSQSKAISINQNKQFEMKTPKSNLRVSLENLRVPLCSCFQYKGLMTLSFDQSQSSAQSDLTDKQKLSDWRQMLKFLGFNSSYFKLKTVQTKVGELIIAYIPSYNPDIYITSKPKKHHNVTFQSPMNLDFLKKSKLSNSSTSIQSILRYIKSIKSIKDTSFFTCPKQEILTTLQYCYLAKYIRKLYRAAQGEIDELNFVNLIVKGDKNLADMLESAGMESLGMNKKNILGIFFEILMYYTGIRCQVDADCLSKYGQLPISPFIQKYSQSPTKIIKCISLHPRVRTYTLSSLELYQSFPSIPKFISQKQYVLAHKSILLKQGCYCENLYQQCYPWPAQSMYLLDQAQINFVQNDYITSIRKSQQFLKAIAGIEQSNQLSNQQLKHKQSHQKQWAIPSPTASIPAYFLMLKCYSKFSKQKFIETLQYTIQTCTYNFGQQSSMIITLYSFAGVTFGGIGDHKQAELFLVTAIKMSQKISSQYSKIQTSLLYLDMSKMLSNQSKFQQSTEYLQKAEQIIDRQGTYDQKISLQINFISILLSKKVNQDNQKALHQVLEKCQKLIVKQKTNMGILTEYYHHVYLICFKYNMRRQWEACIENLWSLNYNAKIIAIKLAYEQIALNFQHISKQESRIVEKWGISTQKSILVLEEHIKNYNGLIEMMNECFIDEDMEIISACLKLLRNRE